MNEIDRKRAIRVLKRIIAAGRNNEPDKGLCGLLSKNLGRSFEDIYRMFPKWPEYSGRPTFPVPAPSQFRGYKHPAREAFHTLPLWEGEYGAARIRLAKFLLQQLMTLAPHTPESIPVKRPWWKGVLEYFKP